MKRIINILLLLIISTATFSQENKPKPTLTKQDYLKKSRHQKTAAWILLGGGATLILTGIIIPKGEITNPPCFCRENEYEYKNDGVKGTLGGIGFLSMIGSIPFFTSSEKNKKRAMSVTFRNEKIMQLNKNSFVYKPVPSLSLKFKL